MFKLIILSTSLFVFDSNVLKVNNESKEVRNHLKVNYLKNTINDEPFTFYTEQVGNSKLLRVSFNGDEGNEGTLKIYNSQNVVVNESNFELIKSPFFASVEITNLPSGNYTLLLTTALGNHTSLLVIQ